MNHGWKVEAQRKTRERERERRDQEANTCFFYSFCGLHLFITQIEDKLMGFAVGSYLNSPGYYSLFPISAQPCSSQSEFLNFFQRNADNKWKNRSAMACMQNGDPNDTTVFCKRRAILFMGISILPLLKLRAEAVEGLAGELGFSIYLFQCLSRDCHYT